ncbi:MAG: protein kinase [Bacteroidota bacterium]
MIGQTISHYKILEKLGGGGMGVVYKAEDTKLRRTVALKFLPPDLTRDESSKKRFIHEAQAASALNHPNICTIHEFDETSEGQVFIVMAVYDGTPLNKKTEQGPLKIEEVLDVAVQVADGLQAAHDKDITHRDVKSSNIMVTEKGRAVIMDFGLARTSGATKLTKTGATLGTVPYMSPEQALGEKVDHRTDIWSLGIVLYEMITGQLPFKSEYQEAIVYSILNQSPQPVTGLRTGVPVELERIINKCLEKKASDRYQHMDELMVDLRKVSQGTSAQPIIAKKRLKLVLAGVPTILLALIGLYFLLSLREASPRIESLAVLPLKNLMGDPEQDYFVEGMHEALTAELSKIAALKVISRTSTMRYKETDKAMPQIARELGVTGLIEGSVLREGDQVRITVQLIDGTTDRHLWAESFNRELRGVLALQSEVARAIANEIEVKLTPQEQARLVAAPTVSPKAYELYLLGRHYWNQRTIRGYEQAVESFRKALEQDPGYGSAYAALADCYFLLGQQGGLPEKEARSLAATALHKALSLDENLAEVHVSQGVWKLKYEWDWVESEREFKRAIELNPGYAAAHQWYGRSLAFAGRFEEAVMKLERARELDPLSPIISAYIGQVYIFARQYDRAGDQLQKALEYHPNHPLILHNLGELRLAQSRYAEAIAPLEKSSELSSTSHYLAILGCAYARANRKQDASRVLNDLQRRSTQGLVSAFDMASLYLALGEREQALTWLEQGFEQRDVWLIELKAWPWFDSLRDDPRFQDLLRRMNFPE